MPELFPVNVDSFFVYLRLKTSDVIIPFINDRLTSFTDGTRRLQFNANVHVLWTLYCRFWTWVHGRSLK